MVPQEQAVVILIAGSFKFSVPMPGEGLHSQMRDMHTVDMQDGMICSSRARKHANKLLSSSLCDYFACGPTGSEMFSDDQRLILNLDLLAFIQHSKKCEPTFPGADIVQLLQLLGRS